MKKFNFRFKAVEKVRQIELDQQIKALALAQQKAQAIEAEIRKMHEMIRLEIERVRKSLISNWSDLEKDMQQVSADFRKNMRAQIDKKRQELMLALQAIERERRKLVQKKKNKQVMEKLHEKEKEDYYAEVRKEETRQLDEAGAALYTITPRD